MAAIFVSVGSKRIGRTFTTFEIALLLVRFDQVASVIVNANDGIM
jgi:hypothetical protein